VEKGSRFYVHIPATMPTSANAPLSTKNSKSTVAFVQKISEKLNRTATKLVAYFLDEVGLAAALAAALADVAEVLVDTAAALVVDMDMAEVSVDMAAALVVDMDMAEVSALVDRGMVAMVDRGMAAMVDRGMVAMVDRGMVAMVDRGMVDRGKVTLMLYTMSSSIVCVNSHASEVDSIQFETSRFASKTISSTHCQLDFALLVLSTLLVT